MSLRIFQNETEPVERPKRQSDDIVGRFRAGYQTENGRPVSITEWRITTGDPEVAKAVYEEFGGEEPNTWAAKGEDNLQVFTASNKIDVIVESEKSLRERMVKWNRAGELVYESDGETITGGKKYQIGDPDPDADLTFQERKTKAREEDGAIPQIEVYFRLADLPDLGVFKFQTGSWGFAQDLARNGVSETLESIGGPARATLTLEPVSFVAKNGPMAGKTVSYTKSSLNIKGKA